MFCRTVLAFFLPSCTDYECVDNAKIGKLVNMRDDVIA